MARAVALGMQFNARSAVKLLNRLNGKFSRLQGPITAAHERAAWEVQIRMREALDAKVKAREGRVYESEDGERRTFTARGTRHLRKAIEDSRNRRPLWRSNWMKGFEVGIAEWLDSSLAAPYWRNLEEGTTAFEGRALRFTTMGTGIRFTMPPGIAAYGAARTRQGFEPNIVTGYHYLRDGGRSGLRYLQGGGMLKFYKEELADYPVIFRQRFGREPFKSGQ